MFQQQLVNVIRSGAAHSKKALAVIAAAPLVLATKVHAAVPAEVTAAVTEAKTDLLTAIGAVIAAMVVVWGLRKLGQKMGWI